MHNKLFFSLAAFKVLTLVLTFDGVMIIMCPSVGLFRFFYRAGLWDSCIWILVSFSGLERFLNIICLNKLSALFSLPSLSGAIFAS